MSFFPRGFPSTSEFGPLFRLLDDYATHSAYRSSSPSYTSTNSIRTFQPRFDVREVKDGYELHGELPGVDQRDIDIEFTDAQTLSIKGRTERRHESSNVPTSTTNAGAIDDAPAPSTEPSALTVDSASSNSYHKASVEDETTMSGAVPSDTSADTTSSTSSAVATPATSVTAKASKAPAVTEQPQHRYWVSERSVGSFHRTFEFPSRIDQDAVKASLKNGILSIVVPKAAAPVSRRIAVE